MHRLLFICPDVLGGVRSYITNLTAYLSGAGIPHAILLYGPGEGMTSMKAPGEIPASTRLHYSRYASMRSIYKEFAEQIGTDDILICSDSLELEAIHYLRLSNRVIFILHGDLDHYNAILKKNEGILDHVFCVSRGLSQKYSQLYPDLGFSVCHPLVADHADSRKYPRTGDLTGVFIGRFEYMKGADVFIDVVKGAIEKKLPVRWTVFAASKGSEKELTEALPERVGIMYDQANEKVLAAVENADLLLFPSRSEGFGIVVLEAMKRGVVPIARDLPIGIPDMITDQETGYLAREADDILRIIVDLNEDREKLGRIGMAAYRFSHEAFGYKETGERFVAHVKRLETQPIKTRSFARKKERIIERLFPELLYRLMKRLYQNSSRGTK